MKAQVVDQSYRDAIEFEPPLDIDSANTYIFVEDRAILTDLNRKIILQIFASSDMILTAQRKSLDFLPYTLVASVLFSLILSYFYSRLINRPIMEIRRVTEQMSNLDKSAQLQVRGNDEIADLKRHINSVYAQLLSTIGRLEERNRTMLRLEKLKVDFLRSASHELKTPLASLKVMLESMLMHIGKYNDHDTYLALSVEKVDQLHSMLKAILTVSRVVEMQEVDEPQALRQLVEEVIGEYEVLIANRQVEVHNRVQGQQISLPRMAAVQVMRNLVSNAVQYSNTHGSVIIWADDTHIHVSNMCRPLNPKEIQESFELLPNSLAHHSTGLGLFLVKNILEHYELPFSFEPTDDGMCFSIALVPESLATKETCNCLDVQVHNATESS